MQRIQPSRQTDRIGGLDIARALAIFGMILENYIDTMHPQYDAAGETFFLNWLPSLLEGRSAPVFVILAGVGLSLMARAAFGPDGYCLQNSIRRRVLKRALFLFVVGFAHSFIWCADILHFFGIYMALSLIILFAPGVVLFAASAVAVLVFPVLCLLLDYGAGWDFATLSYSGMWTASGTLRHIFFNGFHPVFPWVAFFITGLWLGRGVLFQKRARQKLLIGASTIVLSVFGLEKYLDRMMPAASMADADFPWILFGADILPPMPLYVLSSGATGIIAIILCLLLSERFSGSRWLRPLVSTGQLSLSIYLGHIFLGLVPLDLLGVLNGRSLAFSIGYAFGFIALSVAFAAFWRSRWKRGPLEWAMRRITG